MKIIAVIPARMASTRFPGKVLFPVYGFPMIEHVRRRATLTKSLSEVIVATCDDDIASAIRQYGGKVIMTKKSHENGTTRVAEAIKKIDCTHAVLLQADEPLLLPRHIDTIVDMIYKDPNCDVWNLTSPIQNMDELDQKSIVKCSTSKTGRILYCFRRSPGYSDFLKQKTYIHKMLGIIAYRKDFLINLASLKESSIEGSESIEQMRILENDYILRSVEVTPSLPSVNEPHEIELILNKLKQDNEQIEILKRVMNVF